ncbi:hypothetical protein [Streptococcus sobrinus]|uniref:hypothetical protein n=2 Tax=Streptococcus sobrinus TaxID=1310 RepID=UPI0002EDEE10|nr:hypothetical protein [Streptococcus sobrinus]
MEEPTKMKNVWLAQRELDLLLSSKKEYFFIPRYQHPILPDYSVDRSLKEEKEYYQNLIKVSMFGFADDSPSPLKKNLSDLLDFYKNRYGEDYHY